MREERSALGQLQHAVLQDRARPDDIDEVWLRLPAVRHLQHPFWCLLVFLIPILRCLPWVLQRRVAPLAWASLHSGCWLLDKNLWVVLLQQAHGGLRLHRRRAVCSMLL